jgi:hypothetical protein
MQFVLSQDLLRRAQEYTSATNEEFIEFLKGEGLSKGFCVMALSMIRGVSPANAKAAVHASRAWAERREFDEDFHELAYHVVRGA